MVRILEMAQFGFIQHWEKTFQTQPDECLTNYNDIPDKPRISLKNLSGAFLILLVGLPLALLAFIVEKIVYYHKKNFGTTRIVRVERKKTLFQFLILTLMFSLVVKSIN